MLSVPFGAWDLEAPGWTNFAVAGWVSDKGDTETFYTRDGLADFIKRQRCRAYAHYGGHYDFFFLPKPTQIILSGSGILKARLGAAQLYDSWFLFQMSLKKLGQAVGRAKYEGKSDRIEQLTLEEQTDHCLNDCWVLATGLQQNREWVARFPHPSPRWPPTSGSAAIYVFESLEPEHVAYLGRQSLSVEEWFDMSQAVSGGRVEIHHIGEAPAARVYAYDINSSYPRSWVEADLPMGPWKAVDAEVPHLPGVYLCQVRQRRDMYPIVAPDQMWKFSGEAWCTSEELTALRDARCAVRVIRGYVSTSVGPLGQRFVAAMYERKQAGDAWAKLAINAAHGKLSQKIVTSSYYLLQDGRYGEDRELGFPGWYQRPLIGAFILARARLRLWRAMEALRLAGWDVYYCDTDCVHTNCPPDQFPGTVGRGLGEWKLEAEAERALYVAPKVYALVKTEAFWRKELEKDPSAKRTKLVCKGFPSKAVTIETLALAADGEIVPVSEDAGLDAFKSQSGWAPTLRKLRRTLVTQKGGKHHGIGGRLLYPDYRDALP